MTTKNIIDRIMNGETVNCYSENMPNNYYSIRYSKLTGMFVETEYHNNKQIGRLAYCIDEATDVIENADHIHIKN